MTGLEKVRMEWHRGSNQNEDRLVVKGASETGSLGLSGCSWFPASEQAAGEDPTLWAFLP